MCGLSFVGLRPGRSVLAMAAVGAIGPVMFHYPAAIRTVMLEGGTAMGAAEITGLNAAGTMGAP
jgi:hypothetical protein